MIVLVPPLSKIAKIFQLLVTFRITFWKICCFLSQDITYFYTLLCYNGKGGRVIHISEKEIIGSSPKRSLKSGYVHLPILSKCTYGYVWSCPCHGTSVCYHSIISSLNPQMDVRVEGFIADTVKEHNSQQRFTNSLGYALTFHPTHRHPAPYLPNNHVHDCGLPSSSACCLLPEINWISETHCRLGVYLGKIAFVHHSLKND